MSQAINNMSVTWSDGSLQTGIKLNVTDTSSNASSLLMDLGTGGGSYTSLFRVTKGGNVVLVGGLQGGEGPSYSFNSAFNGTAVFHGSYSIGWAAGGASLGTSADTRLSRDAAGTLAQRNALNGQTYRVYGRYTDGSNYERLSFQVPTTSGTTALIGTEHQGAGFAARALGFQTNGSTRFTLGTDGAATFTGSLTSGPATFNGASSTIASFQDISTGSIFTVNNSAATALLDVTDVTSGDLLQVFNSSGTMVFDVTDAGVANAGTSFALGTAADVVLTRDGAANTLAQRNGTAAQIFRLYSTWTDANNYERFFISAPTAAAVQIGTQKLGTGTARALEFQTDGTTRLTIPAAGGVAIAFSNSLTFTNRVILNPAGVGILALSDSTGSDFSRLQFGGTGASAPAIKRSTTTLQARLADDSAFTNIQGKLTTETAYTAGAPTATGYLVLYDSNGTAYKVPAEAL